jgi:hypothetical protein
VVVVFGCPDEGGDWLCYNKVRAKVGHEAAKLVKTRSWATVGVKEGWAIFPKFVNDSDGIRREVATMRSSFLEGGKSMFGMKIEDFRDLLSWVTVPEMVSLEKLRDEFKGESGFADVGGTDA